MGGALQKAGAAPFVFSMPPKTGGTEKPCICERNLYTYVISTERQRVEKSHPIDRFLHAPPPVSGGGLVEMTVQRGYLFG